MIKMVEAKVITLEKNIKHIEGNEVQVGEKNYNWQK